MDVECFFLPESTLFMMPASGEKKRPAAKMLRDVGGNMWESNPPKRLFTPVTGFEDQGAHQHPSTPECGAIITQNFDDRNRINAFFHCNRAFPRSFRTPLPGGAHRRLF